MSIEYCHECDKMIDLDVDEHFEHFGDEIPTEKDAGFTPIEDLFHAESPETKKGCGEYPEEHELVGSCPNCKPNSVPQNLVQNHIQIPKIVSGEQQGIRHLQDDTSVSSNLSDKPEEVQLKNKVKSIDGKVENSGTNSPLKTSSAMEEGTPEDSFKDLKKVIPLSSGTNSTSKACKNYPVSEEEGSLEGNSSDTQTLSDKIEYYKGMKILLSKDVREFIKDIPNGIKQSIERGQFNEAYFEDWLKKRVGKELVK